VTLSRATKNGGKDPVSSGPSSSRRLSAPSASRRAVAELASAPNAPFNHVFRDVAVDRRVRAVEELGDVAEAQVVQVFRDAPCAS